MKLLFVARALDNMAGGVERMIITLANEMSRRGHDVALMTWDGSGAQPFYEMDPHVRWLKIDIGNARDRASLTVRIRRARAIRQSLLAWVPDLIICFQGGPFMAMLAYTIGTRIPLIAAERTAPTLYDYANSPALRRVEHFSFRFARCITVQFPRYRVYYPSHLRSKIIDVANPVTVARCAARPGTLPGGRRWRLLSVGRLSFQKNHKLLIEAFRLLACRFADWDLRIVGDGEDRQHLYDLINQSHMLKDRVGIVGAVQDVEREYVDAHLFCLASRWEGFPNALAEALAHGLPSIGMADCAGVADLIVPGVNGALASDQTPQSLADTLAGLMANHHLRDELGRAGLQRMTMYGPGEIFQRWQDVFEACLIGPDAVRRMAT